MMMTADDAIQTFFRHSEFVVRHSPVPSERDHSRTGKQFRPLEIIAGPIMPGSLSSLAKKRNSR